MTQLPCKLLSQAHKLYIINKMFKSKAYIRSNNHPQELECTICYDISVDIVRCQGPCHKNFCLKCVSRSKYKEGPCPNRCSKVFEIQPITGQQFTFNCPYKENGCNHISESEAEFEVHYKTCIFINQLCQAELQHIYRYQCPSGHRLTFLTEEVIFKIYGTNNYYFIFMNERCSRCHEVTLCRSICLQCTTQDKKVCFCTRCRQLPCTKTLCPVGHELKVREGFSYTLTCDFCGISGLIFGDTAYEDAQCNFDICLRCYQKLQEVHPLIPLENNVPEPHILQQQF